MDPVGNRTTPLTAVDDTHPLPHRPGAQVEQPRSISEPGRETSPPRSRTTIQTRPTSNDSPRRGAPTPSADNHDRQTPGSTATISIDQGDVRAEPRIIPGGTDDRGAARPSWTKAALLTPAGSATRSPVTLQCIRYPGTRPRSAAPPQRLSPQRRRAAPQLPRDGSSAAAPRRLRRPCPAARYPQAQYRLNAVCTPPAAAASQRSVRPSWRRTGLCIRRGKGRLMTR